MNAKRPFPQRLRTARALLLCLALAALPAAARGLSERQIERIFALEKRYIDNAWGQAKAEGKMPRSTEKGLRPIDDWTSGFYPGSIWLAYQYSRDPALKRKGEEALEIIKPNRFYTHDHDIGFMIHPGYGLAYRLTGDPAYAEVIVQASKTALKRYDPVVKSIMSWNPNPERDWKFPVIVDNLMNLEMLLKASALSGDPAFRKVALAHADTTMKHQYRADYSCAHVVDYDPATGAMRKRDWNNGNSDPATAAWSRGQGWGLYGFGFLYRDTRKARYLRQAEHIADYILGHPNLPEDMVPYWDFNAPQVPTMRDASAAALIASGLLQLAPLSKKNGERYFLAAEKILTSLASPAYLDDSGQGYFLLKHATGNYLRKSELDGGLSYADYYFLEALLRYRDLKTKFTTGKTP